MTPSFRKHLLIPRHTLDDVDAVSLPERPHRAALAGNVLYRPAN
jgi:hypothetical protein